MHPSIQPSIQPCQVAGPCPCQLHSCCLPVLHRFNSIGGERWGQKHLQQILLVYLCFFLLLHVFLVTTICVLGLIIYGPLFHPCFQVVNILVRTCHTLATSSSPRPLLLCVFCLCLCICLCVCLCMCSYQFSCFVLYMFLCMYLSVLLHQCSIWFVLVVTYIYVIICMFVYIFVLS